MPAKGSKKTEKATPAVGVVETPEDENLIFAKEKFGKMRKSDLLEVIAALIKENRIAGDLANENHRMNNQLEQDNERIAHGKSVAERRQSQTIETTAEFLNSLDVQLKMFRKALKQDLSEKIQTTPPVPQQKN